MRSEIVEIENVTKGVKDIELDISKLRKVVMRFYNSILMKDNFQKNLFRLLEAKSFLNQATTILINIIDENENTIISKYKEENSKDLDELKNFFSNFEANLDKREAELLKLIQHSNITPKITMPFQLKSLLEEIKNGMESIVLYPLTIAVKNFKDSKLGGDKKEIFRYYLFKSVLETIGIKGSEQRLKSILMNSSGGNIYEKHTHQETQRRPTYKYSNEDVEADDSILDANLLDDNLENEDEDI